MVGLNGVETKELSLQKSKTRSTKQRMGKEGLGGASSPLPSPQFDFSGPGKVKRSQMNEL